MEGGLLCDDGVEDPHGFVEGFVVIAEGCEHGFQIFGGKPLLAGLSWALPWFHIVEVLPRALVEEDVLLFCCRWQRSELKKVPSNDAVALKLKFSCQEQNCAHCSLPGIGSECKDSGVGVGVPCIECFRTPDAEVLKFAASLPPWTNVAPPQKRGRYRSHQPHPIKATCNCTPNPYEPEDVKPTSRHTP